MTSILCTWTLLYLATRLQLKLRDSLSCARTQALGFELESKHTAPLTAQSLLGRPKPIVLALAVPHCLASSPAWTPPTLGTCVVLGNQREEEKLWLGVPFS